MNGKTADRIRKLPKTDSFTKTQMAKAAVGEGFRIPSGCSSPCPNMRGSTSFDSHAQQRNFEVNLDAEIKG